jgi:hypothetical protein
MVPLSGDPVSPREESRMRERERERERESTKLSMNRPPELSIFTMSFNVISTASVECPIGSVDFI